MAKAAPKKKTQTTSVTRIKAKDETTKEVSSPKAKAVPVAKLADKTTYRGVAGYLAGSWGELRQVRWPNRRTTWAMTGAVLVFTGFLVAVIVLLDMAFKLLFELIIK